MLKKFILRSLFLFVSISTISLYGCDSCKGGGDDDDDGGTTVEETPVSRGMYLDMTVDSSGRPLLSFYDAIETSLVFATGEKKGDEWSFSLVTVDGADESDVGMYTSIISKGGGVSISYYDRTNTGLKYATRIEGNWLLTSIDGNMEDDVGVYSSMAINDEGKVFISYHDLTNGRLKLAENTSIDGDDWIITIVDPVESNEYIAGRFSTIALLPGGEPIITYVDETNGYLKVAKRIDGVFTIETIDGVVGEYGCEWPSIAVRDNGEISITYQTTNDRNLHLARYSEGIWSKEIVDDAKYMGADSHILYLKDGRPAVSYFDGTNNDLKFAVFDQGGWRKETIVSEGAVGYYNCMVQAPDSTLYFAWFSWTTGDIGFTTKNL